MTAVTTIRDLQSRLSGESLETEVDRAQRVLLSSGTLPAGGLLGGPGGGSSTLGIQGSLPLDPSGISAPIPPARSGEPLSADPGAASVAWVVRNRRALAERHASTWVAIIDRRVVASSPTPDGLQQEITRLNLQRPLIAKVSAVPAQAWRTAYGGC